MVATTVNASDPFVWRCVKLRSSIALMGHSAMDDVRHSNYGAGAYAVLMYKSSYGWRCYG